MTIIKKAVLCNLFVIMSTPYLLQSQDTNLEDTQDLILICDSCPEEIYPIPLEDTDSICLISEIENYIDGLEIDPSVKLDASISEEPIILEAVSTPQAIHTEVSLPVTFDDTLAIQQKSFNQDDIFNLENIIEPTLQNSIKLEDSQASENCSDCVTVPVDTTDIMIVAYDGIPLTDHTNDNAQQDKAIIATDDDIVRVPHELINSVKKAAKQNKKLEKENKKSLKKSKKKNKK